MVNRDLVLMLEDVIKDVCKNHTSVEEVVYNIELAFDKYYKNKYGSGPIDGDDALASISNSVRQRHFTA